MKKPALIGLTLMLLLGMLPFSAAGASVQGAAFRLVFAPGSGPELKRGEAFGLQVNAGAVTDLFGMQFTIEYDPSLIRLSSGGVQTDSRFQPWVKETDAGAGRITLAMTRKTLPPEGREDVTAAVMRFEALQAGEANIRLSGIKATDSVPKQITANAEDAISLTITDPSGNPDPSPSATPSPTPGWSATPSPTPSPGATPGSTPGSTPDSGSSSGPVSAPGPGPAAPPANQTDLKSMKPEELYQHGLTWLKGMDVSRPESIQEAVSQARKALERLASMKLPGEDYVYGNSLDLAAEGERFTEQVRTYIKALHDYDRILTGVGLEPKFKNTATPFVLDAQANPASERPVKLALSAEGLNLLSREDLELRITMRELAFSVPAGAWPTGTIPAGEQAPLMLHLIIRTEQATPGLPHEYNPVSAVYDIRLEESAEGRPQEPVTHFAKPVRVELKLPDSGAKGADRSKLGVYGLDQNSREWTYAGGRPQGGFIHFSTDRFCRYAVMEYDKRFTDVEEGHWAFRAVGILAAKHIAAGTEADRFSPDRTVTRAEFIAFLTRARGLRSGEYKGLFQDVREADWYASAVEAAAEAGIVSGVGNGLFRPEERITREQMAVMAANALKPLAGPPAAAGLPFEDGDRISAWAWDAVQASYGWGLIDGMTETRFDPQAFAGRAQAAAVIVRLLEAASLP